jgi:hypothetical protein
MVTTVTHCSWKGGAMPLINSRTRQTAREATTRLDRANNETLYARRELPRRSPEYVLNQLIDTVLTLILDALTGAMGGRVCKRRQQPTCSSG